METLAINKPTINISKTSLWIGRVISTLCTLFLLFDAVTKIIKESHVLNTSATLGIPEQSIVGTGVLLLLCVILYVIPRTAVFGALLLTGFLGGAMAIMMRAGQPIYFSLVFGILVWLGLYLRSEKLRSAITMLTGKQ